MGLKKDTWLYGAGTTKRQKDKVLKSAIKSKGQFDASSDTAFRFLTEDPRERAAQARITEWGVSKNDKGRVSVVKSKKEDDEPKSRQLRDPFTTFYVQGIALEPPLPPDRLLNLTEENALHAACIKAKADDACGRGWEFKPKADVLAELKDKQKKPGDQEVPGQQADGSPAIPKAPRAAPSDEADAQQPQGQAQPPQQNQPPIPGQQPPQIPGLPAAPKPPDPVEELLHSKVPRELKQRMEDITPELTFTEMLTQAAWEMEAIGWAVWEVVRKDNDGTPGKQGDIFGIFPIPAHTIRATLDPRKWVQIRAGRVRYFKKFGAECTINNETGEIFDWDGGADSSRATAMNENYVASEIILFKTYTPRSLWYGLPKWISSIATIAELGAIREFNVSWFASGGQVDYHMHFKGSTEEAAKDMKTQVEDQIRENAGRGHTKLFTAGDENTEVTANKLGDTLREGHFRFRRGDLVKEVLISHAVPPYRIGWAETGSLGGNAAPEMLKAYQIGAIQPLQAIIEDRLKQTLFDPKIGINTGEFELKLEALELTSEDVEIKMATAGVESAFMSPNEAREHVGLEPKKDNPELDKFYYKGQPLGTPPPSPFGGAKPGEPNPFVKKPEDDSGDGQDQGQQGPQPGPQQPQFGVPKSKAAADAAATVREMISDYEAKLKAVLVDNDPIDSDQPPSRRPRRGRGSIQSPQAAGPARADKPNIGA